MANKKITDLMSGTPVRDSLLESAIDISGTMDSRKVKAGVIADLASANVAAPYDTTVTYAIGQYCLHEGNIYRCIAITTGAFDSTKWTQIVVTGEFRRVVELTSAQYTALSSAEQNNGTLYILTDEETTADDIPYSAGVSVGDILDIQTNKSVSSASFTANSSNASNTVLSDDINLVKGLYLISLALPVMSVSTFSVQVVGTNITKYGSIYPKMREQTTMTFLLSVNDETDTICLKSAESTAVTFTYLDRGGLFAYRLA